MLSAKTGYVNDRFDIWLLRLNDQFDTLWTRTLTQRPINIQNGEDPFGFTAVGSSGYLLCGRKLVGISMRAIAYRLDTSGAITWTSTYGGSPNGNNIFWWPIALSDGGFLLAGEYVDSVTYASNVYLVRTDAFGQQAVQTSLPYEPSVSSLFYPNPVSDRLYWQLSGQDAAQVLLLELFSVDGKLMLRKDDLPLNGSLELEKLPAGLYSCRMSFGNQSVVRKLIVE